MYRPQHFIHNLTARPRRTVAVRRDKPFDVITADELEQVLTDVSGVPDVTKHECWWVSGDFCIRAFDAPVYRAAELADDLEHWDKDFIAGVKRTGWVVLFDVTVGTYLCSAEACAWCEYLYPFTDFADADVPDERRDEMDEAQRTTTENAGDYLSMRRALSLPRFVEDDNRGLDDHPGDHDDARKTREQEWEEQREAWCSNCPL